MQDIRQSEMYVEYMQGIGWVVEEVDGVKVFIKRFPLIGSVIKIQRQGQTLSVEQIDELAKKYRAWSVSIEPSQGVILGSEATPESEKILKRVQDDKRGFWTSQNDVMGNGFKVNNNPYLPTKTIRIDLTASEEKIFHRFAEAKRRAVRRATKNGVVVKESNNVKEFIKLKSKDFWPLGWFMARDVRALWESFRPKNAAVFLAYCHPPQGSPFGHPWGVLSLATPEVSAGEPVAGILLLFYDKVSYYWMVAATNEGKKLFAPTLLVWEALKLSKKKECKVFDFEGIYDERFHKATKKWQGFTKFKQGFGGKEVTFPKPLIRHYRAF